MRKTILTMTTAFALIGCQSTEEQLTAAGTEPLAGAEIVALMTGNTLYIDGGNFEHHSFYAADGTARGTTAWDGGSESAAAVWEVNDAGHWCRDWDNDWGGGGYGCAAVYPDGEGGYWFIHQSGTHSETRDFQVRILEGNPQSL